MGTTLSSHPGPGTPTRRCFGPCHQPRPPREVPGERTRSWRSASGQPGLWPSLISGTASGPVPAPKPLCRTALLRLAESPHTTVFAGGEGTGGVRQGLSVLREENRTESFSITSGGVDPRARGLRCHVHGRSLVWPARGPRLSITLRSSPAALPCHLFTRSSTHSFTRSFS